MFTTLCAAARALAMATVLAGIAAAPALAQSDAASLTVLATDTSGGAVPGASVTVRNLATQLV
jgi:hypothetical protein